MKLQPSLGAAYMAQGELLSDFGRYSESAQMFKRLAAMWPDNALVLSRLGGAYSFRESSNRRLSLSRNR